MSNPSTGERVEVVSIYQSLLGLYGDRGNATVLINGNCNDGTEGAVAGTVIGTYPHGLILARNPALADHVLELALGHELPPLVRPEIDKLRRQRLARVRRSNAHRRTRSREQTRQLASGSR